jgi:heat shock protein HslJ
MRTALLLASAAALSACTAMGAPAPSPAPPQSGASERYRAHGTEPFWDITIAGGRIVYNTPEPGERIEVAAPSPRTTFNGHRYLTARFTVDITHGRCNDGMADRYYADTVRVIFPGTDRALEGCGGATLPPDTLADGGWHIRAIDGEAIADSDTYALEFAGGRLSGRAGCNRFSGTYSQTGTTLTAGPIMATRMACPGRMAHERTVMNLLRGPVTISFPDGDTMLLAGNGVTVRLVRQ